MSQSVSRALVVLIALSEGAQSLDDLATRLGVHKSTVLRLLQTMEAQRFVTHDDAHRYSLGTRMFELASHALESRDVRTIARPHLRALGAATGQTVHLAAYESGDAVYLDKVDAAQAVRMYSRIGRPAPLHCTAVGKILVSALPPEEWPAIAARLDYHPFTPRTLRTPEQYLAELALVAKQGFAEDHEEHESFVNCVGVGIRDGFGATVAAISVSVPDMLLDHDQVLALLPQVKATADAISAELGAAPARAVLPKKG
ncbi:IclR family transcriptional regulator [Nocardia camponoti]|uniref:IclR family transcriptional regulator n=1 Tax=Nocardia camponoti TaxID=1616106 RepID=A0A917QTE2_9NOCA|nr:IclR family transcriptional regulator [Nocardia camponoti]GGK67363.1 IclR family transcriptional regulator [Nocardia camponoti]